MLAQHADSNTPFTTTGSASNSLPTLKLVPFVGPAERTKPIRFGASVSWSRGHRRKLGQELRAGGRCNRQHGDAASLLALMAGP